MLYAKMSNSELGIAPRFTFWNLASVLTVGAPGVDGLAGLAGVDGVTNPLFPPFPGADGLAGAVGVFLFLPISLFLMLPTSFAQLTIARSDITNSINFLFFFIRTISLKNKIFSYFNSNTISVIYLQNYYNS